LASGLAPFRPVTKVVFFDVNAQRARDLARRSPRFAVAPSIRALVKDSDMVVEAASQAAAREVAPMAIRAGKDVLVMSLGAMADERLWKALTRGASAGRGRLHLPSGALGGLEAVASAREGGLTSVRLQTRKPPRALAGVAYLQERGVDVSKIRKATVVFRGSARQAVSRFPANINVAAALSLAGVGFDRTRVEIIADPRVRNNQHEVRARGAFGELRCTVRNAPSPDNPKTSYLAALSALATVKNAARGFHFGP
jgi:aspartate dehydrogenase